MKLKIYLVAICMAMICTARADTLRDGFQSPPGEYRTRVWWHWMGTNISREGIARDLEALKETGLGGTTILGLPDMVGNWDTFEIENNPWPQHTTFSDLWYDLVAFAASESGRLGLSLSLHNCAGYSTSGGPWITPEQSMQKLVHTKVEVSGAAPGKITLARPDVPSGEGGTPWDVSDFYRDVAVIAVPKGPGENEFDTSRSVNLSNQMKNDGTFEWTPPSEGTWVVFRIGRCSTGKCVHPASKEGRGLETDKHSAEATEFHFTKFMNPILKRLDANGKKGLRAVLIDSYEAGDQWWSESFAQEFKRRRGYDPLAFLPVLTIPEKQLPKDDDRIQRFIYDHRRTVTELYSENYYGKMGQLCRKEGLIYEVEPYGSPAKTSELVADADLPMDEFWTGSKGVGDGVARAAIYAGKPVVAAEAFTAKPPSPDAKWAGYPAGYIRLAHMAYLAGINQFYLHTYAQQPFPDHVVPGMTMGQWGSNFSRTQTWWNQSRPFFDYFARCHYLLQQGIRVEDAFDLERCKEGVFLNEVKVENGRIVGRDGNTFYWLNLPDDRAMRPEIAAKIKKLVMDGAIAVGPKPQTAPGLENYPQSEKKVQALAEDVWGFLDGKTSRSRSCGKGKMLWGQSPWEVIAGYVSDVDFHSESSKINFSAIHRRTKDADIYFVVNLDSKPAATKVRFRVTGRQPELWDPADGSVRPAKILSLTDKQTEIAIELEADHAIFVVFNGPVRSIVEENWQAKGQPRVIKEIAGEWEVGFPPNWGAPEKITLPQLKSLSLHETPGVKYFSGQAVYQTTFTVDSELINAHKAGIMLDLGKVCYVAGVTLNGRDLGVVWRLPYRLDVTRMIKPGKNTLELHVTNTWANRMIGDQQEPDDCQWETGIAYGLRLKAYPDWFKDYLKDGSRPSKGRYTFCVTNKYKKEDPLPDSGLMGPVTLLSD